MPALSAAVATIVFTGLTILDVRNVSQKKVDVMVLQRPEAAPSDYYDDAVIPKHIAFIRFDCNDVTDHDCASLDPSRRNPDLIFTREKTLSGGVQKTTYGVIILDREEVTLNLLGQTAPDIQANLSSTSNKAQVPSLRAICRRCGPLLNANVPSVGGLVHLTTGKLFVRDDQDNGAQ